MQEKVERCEVRQLESLDVTSNHPSKMFADPIARQFSCQEWIPFGLQGDDADVRRIALVARARVRDVHKTQAHQTISTFGWMTRLSMSAGQYATISSTFGLPPANPVTLGGPFKTSGAISRVNLSTIARSSERTPTRNWTSGRSRGTGGVSGPCVAFAPTNSVRILSKRSPRRSSRSRRTRSASCAFSSASGQAYTSVPTALKPLRYATETFRLSVGGFPRIPWTRTRLGPSSDS